MRVSTTWQDSVFQLCGASEPTSTGPVHHAEPQTSLPATVPATTAEAGEKTRALGRAQQSRCFGRTRGETELGRVLAETDFTSDWTLDRRTGLSNPESCLSQSTPQQHTF